MIKKTLVSGIVGVTLLTHASALIDVSPTAVQYNLKSGVQPVGNANASATIKTKNVIPPSTVPGKKEVQQTTAVTIGTSMIQGGALPMSVSSTEELDAYKASILKTEASIYSIDAESKTNAISVTWKNKGRFLGVIPVHVKSKTTVEASSQTAVAIATTLPWWSFFVTDVENLATVTDASLKNSDEIKMNMKVDTSAQAKGHVIHAIVAHVSAIAQAQASTEVD